MDVLAWGLKENLKVLWNFDKSGTATKGTVKEVHNKDFR